VTIPYGGVLITGGSGFVGSNLATWIKERYPKVRVVAFDNLRRRGSELNLSRLRAAGVEFIHGDVRNPEDLRLESRDLELLVECSAEPSALAGSDGSPAYVINTNLLGTVNCLELARRTKMDLLFLSTSRVYPVSLLNQISTTESPSRFVVASRQPVSGVSDRGISEDFPLIGPRSLYGATKFCSELLIHEYGEMYGLRFVIDRCSVLAGPWQMGKVDQGVFTLWVASHYFQRELQYIGWGGMGKQVRDVLHIEDLAALLELQLHHWESLHGETFNVGGGAGGSLSLLETTRLCEEITGHRIPITASAENRPGDIRVYVTDNTRITKATGWTPRLTPRDVLNSILNWIREAEPQVRHLWT
jgi:CDP-paratose 2-epimerase